MLPFLHVKKQEKVPGEILHPRSSGGFTADEKGYTNQQNPDRTITAREEGDIRIDRVVHVKRIGVLTEETRDLREQIEVPHCLQASEPPSGICEYVLEVAGWWVVLRDPDADILWRLFDGTKKKPSKRAAGDWSSQKSEKKKVKDCRRGRERKVKDHNEEKRVRRLKGSGCRASP